MTKDREIALLGDTIRRFGPDSYIGPWLSENLPALVADIRNDLSPSPVLPGEARRMAADLIADAKREADAIVAAARDKGAKEIDAARSDAAEIRTYARRALESALARI